MKYILLCLCLGVLSVHAQDMKEITVKNFEKKVTGDCKNGYLKYENDPFTKKVKGETHKFALTADEKTFVNIDRNDQAFVFRIHDRNHDVRNYDVCMIMLQNGEVITTQQAVKLGHKGEGKNAEYTRDFPITKDNLEKIKAGGVKNIRLENNRKAYHNYEIPAENETLVRFILGCILAN